MWSGGFSIILDFEPARSIHLRALVGLCAGLALSAIASSGLPRLWQAGLMALALAEAARQIRRYGPRGAHRIGRLRLAPDGACAAAFGDGPLEPVGFRCGWAWPVVAVGIVLTTAGGGIRPVVLFRDQIDAPTWRRLLVRCRQANSATLT